MSSLRRTDKVLSIALLSSVLLSSWSMAEAGDVDDKDFSLRFPAALTRFSTYGDVAGVGGASAGSKWSSSANPASTAWMEDPPRHLSLIGQYSLLDFGNGTNFCIPTESVSVDAGPAGFFTGSAAQVSTNRDVLRNGLGFRFAGDVDQLLWAKKLSEDWAVGSAFTYSKTVTRLSLGSSEIAKSDSDSYSVRGGVLRRISSQWLAGLVLDYGWSRDRTDMFPGLRVIDSTRQLLVRPGVSYEYVKDGTVYLDYQFGTFWNDTGRLDVHRILGGIEHGFTKWLFARAGMTVDPSFGGTAFTGGLGLYPTSWLSLDIAYQYDMFPEIHSEFGRGQTFTVSVAFTF